MLPPILYGTLREHYLVLFGAAGAVSVVVGSVSAWLGARFGSRRIAREAAEQALRSADVMLAQRLDLLQQSVDSTAIEVERVAEAQRFAARLLAEPGARPDALPRATPRAGEYRVKTPH